VLKVGPEDAGIQPASKHFASSYATADNKCIH